MNLFHFTPLNTNAAAENLFEYDGLKIGLSNIITASKNLFLDRAENKVYVDEYILEKMFSHIKAIEEKEKMFFCDVIIHGVRVRLTTNSKHLSEFFTENFYNAREYSEQLQAYEGSYQTSIVPYRINIYAINGIFENNPGYDYNPVTNTIYIFNCSFYKLLFLLVTEAVSKILREERGFFLERSATFEKNKKNFTLIMPEESSDFIDSIYNHICFKIMADQSVKLQAMSHNVFRLAFKIKNGGQFFSPIKINLADNLIKKGIEAVEFFMQCSRDQELIEKHKNAVIQALTPSDKKAEFTLADFDFTEKTEIITYSIFKNYYQRTDIIKHYPNSLYQFLHSKLENIPEITEEYFLNNAQYLENFVRNELRNSKDASIAKYFNSISEEDGKKYVGRLEAFETSHVIIDYSKVFGRNRISSSSTEPAYIDNIFAANSFHETDFKSAVFLRAIDTIKENEEKKSHILIINNMLNKLRNTKAQKYEINLYENIKNIENTELINTDSIYSLCVKKMTDIDSAASFEEVTGAVIEKLLQPQPV
ncbi:MAG: hypothetical protein QMC67_10890 [Candidatus Wallbacteria bacterium]